MDPNYVLFALIGYVLLLFTISALTGKSNDNASFYSGDKRSSWYVVAFGMIGATLSGISVVSVPGMVQNIGFTYMQMVLGFFFGYLAVTEILLPLYYKLKLTSIYEYLGIRFGQKSHQTGACFFLLFKLISAAARLYIVIFVLQLYFFDAWNIPFAVSCTLTVAVIFGYTFRSGIRAIIWTDFFQTLCLIVATVLISIKVYNYLDMDISGVYQEITRHDYACTFVFDDWGSRQNFFKQFLSGIFIVIVMTGLDQDIMQKNLSCKNYKEARRNMISYGFAFIPVNLILLILGALMLVAAHKYGIALPAKGDEILPLFAMDFGGLAAVCFVIGLVAAAFSSADSALVSLTTSIAVDILHTHQPKQRFRIHLGISVLFIGVILLFRSINNNSAIDAIYTIVSYLYGPLLGLFAFGISTKLRIHDKAVPWLAILAPIVTYGIQAASQAFASYSFGYELLILNGGIMFGGLFICRKKGQPFSHPSCQIEKN